MYYKEAENGQLLEEGITEAGSMSWFNAAGTAYSQHGVNMIPFFIYYSMFGFHGHVIRAAADMQAKGFLMGARQVARDAERRRPALNRARLSTRSHFRR